MRQVSRIHTASAAVRRLGMELGALLAFDLPRGTTATGAAQHEQQQSMQAPKSRWPEPCQHRRCRAKSALIGHQRGNA